MIRVLSGFFPAVIAAYVIGSLLATQLVLANLASMGVDISLTTRLHASLHDLLGMATSYLLLILVAFIIALPVAAGLARWPVVPGSRTFWFTLAGFVALVALHLIMRQVLGVWPIAAAREWPGLLMQGCAGAVGGFLYSYISRPGRLKLESPGP
ncbi:hypothetical protein CWI75_04395 [Kineobactrum sediminis]|uniref:Uncharacterized protein n=1 Tax=Kineobactrum sediminis TaxID=1905677 RepID=A0A2N5Y5C1_9GAMM|nr:hypothetical protein [Kineobactrum sediminis]PLW83596.1 hypothetical protein CWI75_04395 [Kineobactrum sediminis]